MIKGEIIAKCTDKKSEDDGSCSLRIPCDGMLDEFGNMTGGCREPCRFVTHPDDEDFRYDK